MKNSEVGRALKPDKPPSTFLDDASTPMYCAWEVERLPLLDMGPMISTGDFSACGTGELHWNPAWSGADNIGSFKQYLMGHFYNGYIAYLRNLIESKSLEIGKRSDYVPVPEAIHVVAADVYRIDLYQKEIDEVYADIIMTAEIEVARFCHNMEVSDRLQQWFRIRTYSNLSPDELSFNNLVCILIYNSNEPAPGPALDEYLIPYTSADVLDSEGTGFLSRYYPEALEKPCRIIGEELARRMGLDVRCYHLTSDNDIRGQIYFEEREAKVISKKGEIIPKRIPANTILVDLVTCENEDGELNDEKLNNTILHECYHGYKHKLFYLGQRLYNDELRCLSCSVTGGSESPHIDTAFELKRSIDFDENLAGERSLANKSPIDWIEWQANKVTPRILMPERTARQKIEELLANHCGSYPNIANPKLIACVVTELANFFGVSKQSAKLRMVELGYPEAQGVLNYANGSYVENFSFPLGSLGANQTFTIELDAALGLYATNEAFRHRIESGHYQYVDGHFCLSDQHYIYRRNGKLRLTSYAKSQMEQCCLAFTMRRGGNNYVYCEGTLQKRASVSKPRTDYSDDQAKGHELWVEAQRLSDIVDNLPGSPCATLREHMKRRKVTVEGLVARSGISESTIRRLRTDREYKPTPESVIAICIGLQLEPVLSTDWMKKEGVVLTNSAKDIFLSMLLFTMYYQPLSAVNHILEAHGFAALCKATDELEA